MLPIPTPASLDTQTARLCGIWTISRALGDVTHRSLTFSGARDGHQCSHPLFTHCAHGTETLSGSLEDLMELTLAVTSGLETTTSWIGRLIRCRESRVELTNAALLLASASFALAKGVLYSLSLTWR